MEQFDNYDRPVVSIVMPVYNAARYLEKAIKSVVDQTYQYWELLIVDDGSQDDSWNVIEAWMRRDMRIKSFRQKNSGVSAARNVALANMGGEFLCFLDSDDWLPHDSLEVRVNKFKESDAIQFVDGHVSVFSEDGLAAQRVWKPDFTGNPEKMLLRLSSRCFFGPTWMIRIKQDGIYRFEERMKHGEDLLFYLTISGGGVYGYVNNVIYNYRDRADSAMKNIHGLAEGYLMIRHILRRTNKFDFWSRIVFEYKIKRIMFLSFLRIGQIRLALSSLVR